MLPACPPVLPRCTIASGWHPPLHYLPQLCQGRAKLALHLLLVLYWFSVHTGHHTLAPAVLPHQACCLSVLLRACARYPRDWHVLARQALFHSSRSRVTIGCASPTTVSLFFCVSWWLQVRSIRRCDSMSGCLCDWGWPTC